MHSRSTGEPGCGLCLCCFDRDGWQQKGLRVCKLVVEFDLGMCANCVFHDACEEKRPTRTIKTWSCFGRTAQPGDEKLAEHSAVVQDSAISTDDRGPLRAKGIRALPPPKRRCMHDEKSLNWEVLAKGCGAPALQQVS